MLYKEFCEEIFAEMSDTGKAIDSMRRHAVEIIKENLGL